MMCTLKVRRSLESSEDAQPYRLQIVSKHAVGGAGGLLGDEMSYRTLPELLQALRDLELPGELLARTGTTLELERAEDRWLPVGIDLQIPFATLEAAGFSLSEGE